MRPFSIIITMLLVNAAVLPSLVWAHDLTVNLSGSIQNNTCSVAADSVNKAVSMGNVAAKSFARVGDTTPPVRFVLNLENCGDATTGVAVELNGIADNNNIQLLALDKSTGNATGLGIALLDEDSKIIPMNGTSKTYPMPVSIDGSTFTTNISMVFYAQYMADGAVVQAGNASASTTFTLVYP